MGVSPPRVTKYRKKRVENMFHCKLEVFFIFFTESYRQTVEVLIQGVELSVCNFETSTEIFLIMVLKLFSLIVNLFPFFLFSCPGFRRVPCLWHGQTQRPAISYVRDSTKQPALYGAVSVVWHNIIDN